MKKKTAVIEKLDWDSNFFGFNIARLNPEVISSSIMKAALRFCKDNRIKCLFYRAAINHPESVTLAEEHGFHFANFRMTYGFDFDLGHTFPQIQKHNFVFRKSRKSDLPQLQAISKNLYLDSRYYYDRNFPRELCDRFYGEWVRKLVSGSQRNQGVYALCDKKKIAGYIGYEISGDVAHLVLVCVNRGYQGHGVGKILLGLFLKKMFKDGFSQFEVVTQGRNIASQRLYQSGGFKIAESHIDYHKWF